MKLKHLSGVIYINACTNKNSTQSRTCITMVLVGQPKYKTILENKFILWEIKYLNFGQTNATQPLLDSAM